MFSISTSVINRCSVVKWFHPYLHHMLDVLLKFCEAFFHRQQTLQSICLWVLREKTKWLAGGQDCNRWALSKKNIPGQTCSICCRSISRAGLMICRCRRNFRTTFSKAFSKITCSKSRSCNQRCLSFFYQILLSALCVNWCWSDSGGHLVIIQKLLLAQMLRSERERLFFFDRNNLAGYIIEFHFYW